MKRHTIRYLDTDTKELWENLPEFKPAVTYKDFVARVYKLYPGSQDDCRWNMSDLSSLVKDQVVVGI